MICHEVDVSKTSDSMRGDSQQSISKDLEDLQSWKLTLHAVQFFFLSCIILYRLSKVLVFQEKQLQPSPAVGTTAGTILEDMPARPVSQMYLLAKNPRCHGHCSMAVVTSEHSHVHKRYEPPGLGASTP